MIIGSKASFAIDMEQAYAILFPKADGRLRSLSVRKKMLFWMITCGFCWKIKINTCSEELYWRRPSGLRLQLPNAHGKE